jgi:hypothetical protein
MKRLLFTTMATLLTFISVSAYATNPAPTSATKALANYNGTWNNASSYTIKTVYNTGYKSYPMVVESSGLPNPGVYIMNAESGTTAPVGIYPESAPTYWDKLYN